MSKAEPTTTPTPWKPPVWLTLVLLTGLVWFSHFYWSNKFGLYEDDYVCIEPHANAWRFPEFKANVYAAFELYIQGRPLMFLFGHSLAFLSTQPGGSFATAYVVACGVQVLNAWLVFFVARRAIGPRFAPVAAVVFALAPADTTQPFLHVCFFVQPAVALMMLAVLAYQKGWRVLSYVPTAMTLITYETCFLPLLLTPFLTAEMPSLRRVLGHGIVLGVVLIVAMGVRSNLGEPRMKQELGDRSVAAEKMVRLATLGSASSLKSFATKPVDAFERAADPEYFRGDGLKPIAAAWAVAVAAMCAMLLVASGARAESPLARRQLVRVALAGVAMVVLSYPASLNREPSTVEGRMSSVHIAAAPAWGLVAGAGLGLVLSGLPPLGRRALWASVATYLAVLVVYHVSVQRDYVRAWAEQQRFWGDVVRLCPDLDDDVIILYPYPRQEYPAVVVNSHVDFFLPGRLVARNPNWKNPPMAVHVGIHRIGTVPYDYASYDWSNEMKVEGGEVWCLHWTGLKPRMFPGKVIALYPGEDGHYHRITGSLEINGVRLPLREPGEAKLGLWPTGLYTQLPR